MEPQDNTNEKELHAAYSDPSQPHHRGSSHKKKKLSLKKKLLLSALFLILFIFLSGWGYVNHLLGKINRMDSATISAEDFVEETDAISADPNIETLSPEEITLQLANQVLKDKDVLNILLIGQDTQPGVSGSRSDSMILATVNQKKKEITITSFMRDLYVDIPGYKKSRLNTAYALGGAKLLDETIERNFGIHIDGNIAVNFSGFARCIDIIGGVDLEMTAAEAGAVNNELFTSQRPILDGTDRQADRWALVGGFQHVNGDEALQYARIRKLDSDFNRTNRQRKLLTAVFDKLKSSDLKTMNALLEEVLPLLSTDISNTKLIGYAAGVLAMQPATFKTDRIPVDGAFREAVVHHMQVLVPDLEKNQLHLKEALYGSDSTSYEASSAPETPKNSNSSNRSNRSSAPQTPAPTAAPATGNPSTANPDALNSGAVNPDSANDSSYEANGSNGASYESSIGNGTSGSSYQYGPGMPAAETSADTDAGEIAETPAAITAETPAATTAETPAATTAETPAATTAETPAAATAETPAATTAETPVAATAEAAAYPSMQAADQELSVRSNAAYDQTPAQDIDSGQIAPQDTGNKQAGSQSTDGGQARRDP